MRRGGSRGAGAVVAALVLAAGITSGVAWGKERAAQPGRT